MFKKKDAGIAIEFIRTNNKRRLSSQIGGNPPKKLKTRASHAAATDDVLLLWGLN